MDYLVFWYKWNSRELKKIITAILKSWLSDNIKKINYVQNYNLNDKKVEKSEEKLILIHSNNYEKLIDFLSKNFPQIQKI
jgi:hypothetical protein